MRAQVALEYLTIMMFSVLVLISLMVAINYSYGQKQLERTQELTDELADTLQREIILASTVHNGYSRTIQLPNDIAGESYQVHLDNQSLIVDANSYTAYRRIPQAQGTFEFTTTITKNESGVYVQ